ncbi:hypothetical protein [Micromonospora sp. CPCC 205561]|uniref:hypothetical protein n=1 Tax=Micromonospora sp. CPCC 205561 TaxID=3122407 RepID=UPI002FF103D9
MADDLFTPTISPAADEARRPPWRPQSLIFPALLGGPAAVTVLALLNGRRLGVSHRAYLAVLGTGLAGLAARLAMTLAISGDGSNRPVRLAGALAGGLVWLVAAATQKRRFRAYELRGGEPASLWLPGLGAVLVIGFVEALLIFLVAAA